ncbi:hypothetical protein HK096_010566, partial [Nowakowskiella sp. JEL0078]
MYLECLTFWDDISPVRGVWIISELLFQYFNSVPLNQQQIFLVNGTISISTDNGNNNQYE